MLLPSGVIPIKSLSTQDVLYGPRTTSYRYELLTHQGDGTDLLTGYLDGVQAGSLQWAANASVKGAGSLDVADLATARAGTTRIGDVPLTTARIRPVLLIDGLPEIPLGAYLVTASPETWVGTGRTYKLELHDRTTVLDQDQVDGSYTASPGTPVLLLVATVLATAGEAFTPDASDVRQLSTPMVWPAGTSKLQIANDLLATLGYNALTVDGFGLFKATPYVRPAVRPITYELLNGVTRELVDGEQSIYTPDWNRDRDGYKVPNKVVAVEAGTGAAVPASGSATNMDPASPYSYPSRGRWIVNTITGVQVPTDVDPVTFLNARAQASLIASSAVQAAVQVKHLPVPLSLGDVVRFANAPAGIDARHVVTSLHLELSATGLMQSALQEVIDL